MATPLEVIASELLKSAIDAEKLFGKTKDQSYKDKAVRLRRIVVNLQELTIGTSSVATLNDLTDVTISAPANAQVLTYNSTTGQWENQTPAAGGGGNMNTSTYDVDNDGIVDGSETTQIIVRNSTGSTLTKGQVVYLSGATGNRPNALLSQADTEATSSKTIGIVIANIANNSDGYVAVNGTLHDLDTSAFTAGDAVWLSATVAGGMTSTIPAEPNHTVFIGYVARSHPTQGRLVIVIQNGYELNELHGVLISSEANNDLLVYESATSLWKNKTFSAIFGGTPLVSVPTLAQVTTAGNTTTNAITVGGLTVNTTANSGGIILQQNGTNIGEFRRVGNNNRGALYLINSGTTEILLETGGFSYIRSNGLGIGTATDAGYKLDVNGTIRSSSVISGLQVTNTNSNPVIGSDGSNIALGTNYASRIVMAGSNIDFIANSVAVARFASANGGVYIGGAVVPTAKLQVAGSITAASAIAQGVYFNNTLVAAANNDVLVGLDINPTFTNGAFTGVTNYAVRSVGTFYQQLPGFPTFGLSISTDASGHSYITKPNGTDLAISGAGHIKLNSGGFVGIGIPVGGYSIKTLFSVVGANSPVPSLGTANGLFTVLSGSAPGQYGLQFSVAGTGMAYIQNMRVDASATAYTLSIQPAGGNVLIGTGTDSGFKLDVVGADSRFNGVRVGLGAGGVTSNTVVGTNALANNTTGLSNTAVGNGSLRYNIDGAYNTAYGVDSLNANTGGGSNVAVGWRALISSLTAYSNVAIGTQALFSNTASNNTAVGTQAAYSNTSAVNITAMGYQALYSNTTGGSNTAFGHQAGYAVTTGDSNSFFGIQSGFATTVGTNNTAMGRVSLSSNTTGTRNIAIGSFTMVSNTTGSENTAVGSNSLSSNISGVGNTALGGSALAANTGSSNVAIGYFAGNSGVPNTTGANNIFIGYQATGVSATESNRTWIGNSSTTSTWLAGNVLVGTTIDAGYKLDVNGTARVQTSLEIGSMAGVTFGGGATALSWVGGGQLRIGNSATWIDMRFYSGLVEKYTQTTTLTTITNTTINLATNTVQLAGINALTYSGTDIRIGSVAAYFNSLSLYVAGSEKARIDSSGNFGLGTTTPSYPLHISSAAAANIFGTVQSTNANGTAAWVAFNDQSDNVVYRVFGSGASGTQMGIALARTASLIANLGGSGKFLIGTYSGTDLVFGTSDTARLKLVDSTGNFLVGTMTDLGNKLEVSGTINSTGYKINNTAGYTGILNIVTNPPGMQNIDIQSGIIVNIF